MEQSASAAVESNVPNGGPIRLCPSARRRVGLGWAPTIFSGPTAE